MEEDLFASRSGEIEIFNRDGSILLRSVYDENYLMVSTSCPTVTVSYVSSSLDRFIGKGEKFEIISPGNNAAGYAIYSVGQESYLSASCETKFSQEMKLMANKNDVFNASVFIFEPR